MAANQGDAKTSLFLRCRLALLLFALLLFSTVATPSDEPDRVEVKTTAAFLTYLDGHREQREVQLGDRFGVVGRRGTFYVVKDGDRQALIAIASVIPVKTPATKAKWEYVVTTANASIVVRMGSRRVPDTVEQGEVFEVLGRPRLGSTLYIFLDNGRTAEIATNLVRTAKPEEQPPLPAVGHVRGPVRLGCEISIDRRRYVYVEFAYPGSLGQRLGLQPGTRILKVNGEEIHSAADYDRSSQLLGGNLRLLVQGPGLDYPEMIEYQDPRNNRQ